MAAETVTLTKVEYDRLKMQAEIDVDFLKELMAGIKDIKEGRIRRVR
ncbi:hypothetical protein HY497_01130 [Candidatus Woesearchaeota archaeon]|nr:hypothetical protein [Candidatus Woesearchaeota archaeon]